mmetsp:Transcript_2312/g.3228  ORF Transcript_2312/g.3228 Transcript_2312/m.3228 type:complete len:267 (+) Transcript_2312:162-962(+)
MEESKESNPNGNLVRQMRDTFKDKYGFGMELDDHCFKRYLRAQDWNIDVAETKLNDTIRWREEFGVETLSKDHFDVIQNEASTGKIYARGFDKQGRVIVYMRPAAENTKNHEGNIIHLVYHMERATKILLRRGTDVEKLCLIIDCAGYSVLNAAPMKTSRASLDILQHQYPERLGVCYIMNAPFLFRAFWNVVYPLIDPVTKKKFFFLKNLNSRRTQETLSQNFELDILETSVGGRNDTPFDPSLFLSSAEDLEFEEALGCTTFSS